MSTIQPITKRWRSVTEPTVARTFGARHSPSTTAVRYASRPSTKSESAPAASELARKKKWRNPAYRQAYMEAAVDQGIAWQIRINRKLRNMTQAQLARLIGTTQNGVSRFEDPEYGAHSLDKLKAIANAFDCALLVKFVSYGDLARESTQLSETEQYAVPYELEIEQVQHAEKT